MNKYKNDSADTEASAEYLNLSLEMNQLTSNKLFDWNSLLGDILVNEENNKLT